MNRKITELIIHCSASNAKWYNFDAIKKDHMVNRGFVDIGYHYGIDYEGMTHYLRPVDKMGAHCYEHNENSIGICVLGRSPKRFTRKQYDALAELIRGLLESCKEARIYAHSEFNKNKTCPNFSVPNFARWYGLADYCPSCIKRTPP